MDPRLIASRRDLLRMGLGAAALGLLASPRGLPRLHADEASPTVARPPGFGTARQVVFLYMIGGPSHFETFDPKPGTENGGPTRTVASALPGVHLADSLPLLARRMDRIALVRSMTSKEGNHDRARYLVHSGYAPQPTVQHPGLGSILSHEKGKPDAELPEYVSVGGPGLGAGYLGVHHAPFVVLDPKQPIANLDTPSGVDDRRRDARLEMLERMNEGFARSRGEALPEAQYAMFAKARRLMDSPRNVAFDISKEPAGSAKPYGTTKFGLACLQARRLIDAGVTCVEVMMNGWDTHDDGFARCKALNGELDQGAAALLDDLKASGKLSETLVVWLGDFGRTPKITSTEGRGHYPKVWSAWFAGGGVQGGRVIGASTAGGDDVQARPVTIPDLFASLLHATGVENKLFHTNGRPITLHDKAGQPVPELFTA
ncbi:MAG: DUF1501 domain-containing protein [Planctomycetia bacterium]